MKHVLLPIVAVCAGAIIASPASAQSAIAPIVEEQLDSAVVMMRSAGLELQGPFRPGALRDGEETNIEVELQAGREYMIVGVCDADCDDMDLVLADATGNRLASDFELDDAPIVAAAISATGMYQLTVSMPSCSVDPCGYGVAVFASR